MNTVYILVGVPGSGKSTWLHKNQLELNILSLSSDEVINTIGDIFGYNYDEIFNDVVGFANRVFLDFVDKYSTDETLDMNIALDRTNMSKKTRSPFLKKFKDFRKVAVVFPTPEKEEWDRRLNSRPGKTIPKYVLESMARNFEMPTLEEGFDEVIVVEN
jgi:predicted kinase